MRPCMHRLLDTYYVMATLVTFFPSATIELDVVSVTIKVSSSSTTMIVINDGYCWVPEGQEDLLDIQDANH